MALLRDFYSKRRVAQNVGNLPLPRQAKVDVSMTGSIGM